MAEAAMKKATRFSFTNNKDTALTAPEKLELARPDESESEDLADQKVFGKYTKFVAAKKSDIIFEEEKKPATTVLGKRTH